MPLGVMLIRLRLVHQLLVCPERRSAERRLVGGIDNQNLSLVANAQAPTSSPKGQKSKRGTASFHSGRIRASMATLT
jgi:hypothetical protein